jgi:hypothetical protein
VAPTKYKTDLLRPAKYLDFALRLSANVTDRRDAHAPKAAVWLSESDSICHQGIDGATNAYVNSLWLVNRLGVMVAMGHKVIKYRSQSKHAQIYIYMAGEFIHFSLYTAYTQIIAVFEHVQTDIGT